MPKKLTNDEYLKRVKNIHGDKEIDYSITIYMTRQRKHRSLYPLGFSIFCDEFDKNNSNLDLKCIV